MGSLVLTGDCTVVMPSLPADSFDACVTDPPYHLSTVKRFGKPGSAPAKSEGASGVYKRASAGFMGQQWDGGDVAFNPETWAEVLRVLKPGAHLVAFGGSRTYHRLACAVEDAGFEIRDQIMWLYGSGFPKSHNQKDEWEGWGTALKPAHEPIVLARKPFKGTVAKNLAEYGVAALNIDGCRVEGAPEPTRFDPAKHSHEGWRMTATGADCAAAASPAGRWPANLCHDGSDDVLARFAEFGESRSRKGKPRGSASPGEGWGMTKTGTEYDDVGSPSRFFYCAKASKKDRDDGLEGFPKEKAGVHSETSGQHITRRDEGYEVAPRANNHPTVKPTDLMRWLCRLVTPPGGAILDPFTGSGSTGRGAVAEGFRFVGIEQDEKYAAIAKARIAAAEVDT